MNEQILNALRLQPPPNDPFWDNLGAPMMHGDKKLEYTPGERESKNVEQYNQQHLDESFLTRILNSLMGRDTSTIGRTGGSSFPKGVQPSTQQPQMNQFSKIPTDETVVMPEQPNPDSLPQPHPWEYYFGSTQTKTGQ